MARPAHVGQVQSQLADDFGSTPGQVPELDGLLATSSIRDPLPQRHPVLAREVFEVAATSPLGTNARRGLADARLLPDDAQDELCLQIVEEEQQRRQELGMDFKEGFRASLPAEERRWKARAALKRAMHDRRLADLRAAITEAEAAGLYAVELDYARNITEAARKDAARIALKDARESRDMDILPRSISEAKEVGLVPEHIESAEKVVAEEVEKCHSRKALLDALKNGSLEFLLAAVARGEAAGLTPLELDRTKSTLAVQQRKGNAREGLACGVRTRDVKKLKAAILEAQMAKLKPSESEAAKETLAQELRKGEARSELKRADILRQGGDVEPFRASVQEAQSAGLEDFELVQPLKDLAVEDLRISARRNLEFARTGRKGGKISKERMLEITRAAVEEGEACDLTRAELAEARELLVEAKKGEARAALAKAVESRDVDALRAAIRHAEGVGLTHLAVYDANRVIIEEETKSEVLEMMTNALAGRRIFQLKQAIKEGMNICLPECEFVELRIALKEEESKAAARLRIQKAVEAAITNEISQKRIIEGLDAAIEEGDAVGLDIDEVKPAGLQLLEIRQGNARELLSQALKKRTIEAMEEALKVANELKLPESDLKQTKTTLAREQQKEAAFALLKGAIRSRGLDDLRWAIQEGDKAVMGSRELTDAKKILKEEERRTEAHEGLAGAIASREIVYLTRWIAKAEGAGLHILGCEDYSTARVVLAEEERKVAARAGLEAAVRSHCIYELRAAAREAEDANLEPHEVENANRTLAEELPIHARAALEKAVAGRRIKELRAAIDEGVAVKLDASELNLPRLALGEEQLLEALRRKSGFEIRRAIEDGERFGVDTLAIENARRELVVAEKKEMARKQLRDSETSRRIDEIIMAMSTGRAAGLQDWEFNFAHKVVEEERRRMRTTMPPKSR